MAKSDLVEQACKLEDQLQLFLQRLPPGEENLRGILTNAAVALEKRFDLKAQRRWASTLQLTLALTSGRSVSISLPRSSKVADLKALAQEALKKRFLRLVTVEGRILTDPAEPLLAAGLQEGDQLTAIVGVPQLAASFRAFALWYCGGGGVVTWGDPAGRYVGRSKIS